MSHNLSDWYTRSEKDRTSADRLAFFTAQQASVVDTSHTGALALERTIAALPERVTALLGTNAFQRKEGCIAHIACKQLTRSSAGHINTV
jgi:hypothetical protein